MKSEKVDATKGKIMVSRELLGSFLENLEARATHPPLSPREREGLEQLAVAVMASGQDEIAIPEGKPTLSREGRSREGRVLRTWAEHVRSRGERLFQLTTKAPEIANLMAQFLVQSPLPASLKTKVLRTEVRLATQRLRNLRRELARPSYRAGLAEGDIVHSRILDFDVAAYSLFHLMFLHEQIFMDLEYCFHSERADPFIVDCGSNIGMSILFFKALYPEARIIGFEPAEQSYTLLKRNIASNRLAGVQVHQAAVGMEDSTVDFFVDPDEPGSLTASTFGEREKRARKKTVVQQVRVSSFIDRKVDLLKLDAEGAEVAVLKDLVSSGVISQIDQMIVEYDHHIEDDRDEFGGFLSQLEENGFGYQIERSRKGGLTQRDLTRARLSRGGVDQNLLVYAYKKRLPSAPAISG